MLECAVIGLGRIAWSDHIVGLRKHPECRLAAVVDPISGRREDTCAHFGIADAYESVEALFASRHVDLTIIASPTMFHSSQAIYAMEHGSDVFCDKPAASDLTEFDAMIAASERTGRKLMVFQPRRCCVNALGIKEILASGKLGKLYAMKLFIGNYVRRNDWQAWRRNGGGMLRNYGAHYVDEFRHLLGETLTLKSCAVRKIASMGDADDVVKILLESAGGVLIDLDINQAAAMTPFVWGLFGSLGSAILHQHSGTWQLRYMREEDFAPIGISETLAAENRQYPHETLPFVEETYQYPGGVVSIDFFLENMVGWIAGRNQPLVPVAETREVMALLEECKKMAERD